jgi:uncharacterized protein
LRIAVVGSGISGLVCAHLLSKAHEIVLFEAADYAGGHTHTVEVPEGDRTLAIDTGFIVFNTRTYPQFVRLLRALNIPWHPSEMTFSARSDRRGFEYAGTSLGSLFVQRRNLLVPSFWRMAWDILRFYREARELLDSSDDLPLGDYLTTKGYSRTFAEDHLLPMVGAVWSTTRRGARDFPARFLVQFFDNHGFMRLRDRVPWLTVEGGSQRYVRAILAELQGELRLLTPVESVRRQGAKAIVKARGREPEAFDHAILALHSDQALSLLAAPTPLERDVLGALPFQPNEAVLHTDESSMPRNRSAWASWNYHLDDEAGSGACITYWMNRLQGLQAARNYFVTLNRTASIAPDRVLGCFNYAHPVFTLDGLKARSRQGELIDHQSLSYCGAYWGNGFHEDGVASALRVCERFGATL